MIRLIACILFIFPSLIFAQSPPPAISPIITATYQDANIRDVIAAFATLSGRTIIMGRDVDGTVTAEIKQQPWQTALHAILQAHGLSASYDTASGIISIESYATLQTKLAIEPLTTQLITLNYAKADSLVPLIAKLLSKDCLGPPSSAPSTSRNCITRGAVAANTATNTILLTETPSQLSNLTSYLKQLDQQPAQVAIKAKILFINRTSLNALGLSYHLSSPTEPTDAANTPPITLGGSQFSAIANANARIPAPTLSLIHTLALGNSSLTTFIDALQESRLANLQAEPSIVTLTNQPAQIQVGQDVPIRVLDANTSTATESPNTAAPRATVSFRSVGVILRVTPHITHDQHILLDIHAENSNAQLASSDIGYVFNKQSATNRLLIPNTHTATIGGLTITQSSQSHSSIPYLSKLPLIGRLFRTTTTSAEQQDLLILITPEIVHSQQSAKPDSPHPNDPIRPIDRQNERLAGDEGG